MSVTVTKPAFERFAEGELRGPENSGETRVFEFAVRRGDVLFFRVTYWVKEFLGCRVYTTVSVDGVTWYRDSTVGRDERAVHYLPFHAKEDGTVRLSVSSLADRYAPSVVGFTVEYARAEGVDGAVIIHDESSYHPAGHVHAGYYEFPSGGRLRVRYCSPFDGAVRVNVSLMRSGVEYWGSSIRVESGGESVADIPAKTSGDLWATLGGWSTDVGAVSIAVEAVSPPVQPQPQPQPEPPEAPSYPDIWDVIKDYMSRIIRDELPCGIDPVITKLLITVNAAVFLMLASNLASAISTYGLIPAELLAGNWILLITSMYIHVDFFSHLGINMTFLYVFGDNVEEATTWRYILYYHLWGVVAGLGYVAQALAVPELMGVPAVGASGAVSGVIGYYISRYPDARVVFMGRNIPAYVFGALFFMEQIALIFMTTNVAWSAHLAGLLAGVATAIAEKKA